LGDSGFTKMPYFVMLTTLSLKSDQRSRLTNSKDDYTD
jgi:hypothetical protein